MFEQYDLSTIVLGIALAALAAARATARQNVIHRQEVANLKTLQDVGWIREFEILKARRRGDQIIFDARIEALRIEKDAQIAATRVDYAEPLQTLDTSARQEEQKLVAAHDPASVAATNKSTLLERIIVHPVTAWGAAIGGFFQFSGDTIDGYGKTAKAVGGSMEWFSNAWTFVTPFIGF